MCKPDMTCALDAAATDEARQGFEAWANAMRALARHPNVYVKLSGAFSEMGPECKAWTGREVFARVRPWCEVVLREFGAGRILFGSDWPVCDIGGPGGDRAWGVWREAVACALEAWGLGAKEREGVWWRNAVEVYGLEVTEEEMA